MKSRVIEALQNAFEDEIPLEDITSADFTIEGDANWLSPTAFYVLDKPRSIETIRGWLEENTRQGIHSIFLVDQRMMPDEGTEIMWDMDGGEWIKALHAINYGRIYTYRAPSADELYVQPVHFEPINGNDGHRRTMYSAEHILNLTDLQFKEMVSKARVMPGTFLMAMWKDGPFWKKQKQEEPKYHKYKSSWDDIPNSFWEDLNREFNRQQAESFWNNFTNRQRYEEPIRQQTKTRAPGVYELLGISPECTKDEAKRAYRKKAMELHPDQHPGEEAAYTVKMQELNAAWERVQQMNGW